MFRINIKLNKEWEEADKLFKDFIKRLQYAEDKFFFIYTQKYYEELKERLRDKNVSYADNIKLDYIDSVKKNGRVINVAVIYVVSNMVLISKLNINEYILVVSINDVMERMLKRYVEKGEEGIEEREGEEPGKKMERMNRKLASVSLLLRYSPWTIDMIPFISDNVKIDAIKVSEREVKGIRRRIISSKVKIYNEIKEGGLRIRKDLSKLGTVNLGHEIVRSEFGLGGIKYNPIWRPVERRFLKPETVIRLVNEDKDLTRIFDYRFKGYNKKIKVERVKDKGLLKDTTGII